LRPLISRMQRNTPLPLHHFARQDVPHLLRHHIRRHKIKRIPPIRSPAVLHRARISATLAEHGRFHLHSRKSAFTLLHQKVITQRLPPRTPPRHSQFHRSCRKTQLGPLSPLLAVRDFSPHSSPPHPNEKAQPQQPRFEDPSYSNVPHLRNEGKHTWSTYPP